jgi:hypothetical protein
MRAGLAAILSLILVSVAGAQTYVVRRLPSGGAQGYGDVHISKAALSGQQVRVWWATLLNPDCTAAGTLTTQLVQPPKHGTLSLSDEGFFPDFQPPNPRAACDTRKSPGKQAFYTSVDGFHGRDKLVLQNATSEGRVRRITIDIDVR